MNENSTEVISETQNVDFFLFFFGESFINLWHLLPIIPLLLLD